MRYPVRGVISLLGASMIASTLFLSGGCSDDASGGTAGAPDGGPSSCPETGACSAETGGKGSGGFGGRSAGGAASSGGADASDLDAGGAAAGDSSADAGGNPSVLDAGEGDATGGDAACATGLDLLFLVDRSGSMTNAVDGGTRWDAVSGALVSLLEDPTSTGVGVALSYFPPDPEGPAPLTCNADPDCVVGQTDFGPCLNLAGTGICSLETVGCSPDDYSDPEVKFTEVASHTAAVISLEAQSAGQWSTRTRPAYERVLSYAKSWSASHPKRRTVVVILTDNAPEGCTDNTMDDVAALAEDAYVNAGIPTFIVQLGDSPSMTPIAARGGTAEAYPILDTGDVQGSVRTALDSVLTRATDCESPAN